MSRASLSTFHVPQEFGITPQAMIKALRQRHRSSSLALTELWQSRDDPTQYCWLLFVDVPDEEEATDQAMKGSFSIHNILSIAYDIVHQDDLLHEQQQKEVEPKSWSWSLDETLEVFRIVHASHSSCPPTLCSADFVGPIEDGLHYCVYFDIWPHHVDAFRKGLIEECHAIQTMEPKMARFVLLQSLSDATRWIVLESFREPSGLQEHAAMPHYQKVRTALEEWQRSPRSHDNGYAVHLCPNYS